MNNIFNHLNANKYFYAKVYFSGMALNTVSFMFLSGYLNHHLFVNNYLTYPERNNIKTETDAIIHGMTHNIIINFLWPFELLKTFYVSGLLLMGKDIKIEKN